MSEEVQIVRLSDTRKGAFYYRGDLDFLAPDEFSASDEDWDNDRIVAPRRIDKATVWLRVPAFPDTPEERTRQFNSNELRWSQRAEAAIRQNDRRSQFRHLPEYAT